jgi:hypothetical protein
MHAACADNLNLDLTSFEALEDHCLLGCDTLHTIFRVRGGATCSSETLVIIYQITQRHIPENSTGTFKATAVSTSVRLSLSVNQVCIPPDNKSLCRLQCRPTGSGDPRTVIARTVPPFIWAR